MTPKEAALAGRGGLTRFDSFKNFLSSFSKRGSKLSSLHGGQVVNLVGDGGEEEGLLALHHPARPHDQAKNEPTNKSSQNFPVSDRIFILDSFCLQNI